MIEKAIDAETLAAFLDGRLSAAERADVLRQLARSPDDYEWFIEAAGIQRDLEADSLVTPITSARSKLGRMRWPAALLAAAAIATLLIVPITNSSAREPWQLLQAGSLVGAGGNGSLDAALGAGWDAQPWDVVRAGRARALPASQVEFRAGVYAADLHLALQAADRQAAGPAASRLLDVLGQVDASGPIAAAITELSARANPGATRSGELLADLREFLGNSAWYDLGVWIEQARLAAQSGNTGFFSSEAKATLSDIIDDLELGPPARTRADTLQSILRQPVTPDRLPLLLRAINDASSAIAG